MDDPLQTNQLTSIRVIANIEKYKMGILHIRISKKNKKGERNSECK